VEDEKGSRDGLRADLSVFLTRLFLPVAENDGNRAILCADFSPENRAWLEGYAPGVPFGI
jgi:hypothetical protein